MDNIEIPAKMTAYHETPFFPGLIPVLGSLGAAATTTVAVAESLATIPLASPVATAVFVVVESILAWQR